jgi:hypothetical protein
MNMGSTAHGRMMDSKSFSYEQDTHCHGLDTRSTCSCRICDESHRRPSYRVGWMGCCGAGCLLGSWMAGSRWKLDAYGCVPACNARKTITRGSLTFGTRWSALRPMLKVSFVVILQMRAAETFPAHTRQAKQVLHVCVHDTAWRSLHGMHVCMDCMDGMQDRLISALSSALAMWEARHRGSALVLPPT